MTMKKWSERSPEERHRILHAPFPQVCYHGSKSSGGASGGSRFNEDRQRELAFDDGTKVTIYSILYEHGPKTGLI
jgi:hypothetical protein